MIAATQIPYETLSRYMDRILANFFLFIRPPLCCPLALFPVCFSAGWTSRYIRTCPAEWAIFFNFFYCWVVVTTIFFHQASFLYLSKTLLHFLHNLRYSSQGIFSSLHLSRLAPLEGDCSSRYNRASSSFCPFCSRVIVLVAIFSVPC